MMAGQPYWRQTPPHTGPALARLMRQTSLTAALQSLNTDFSVRLLYLGLSENDFGFSDRHFPREVFVRDVLLYSGGRPAVFARSVCLPADTAWRKVLDCGTQPLGAQLFGGGLPLKRTPFEFCSGEGLALPRIKEKALSARRSLFDLEGSLLGLAECFLSGLENL